MCEPLFLHNFSSPQLAAQLS